MQSSVCSLMPVRQENFGIPQPQQALYHWLMKKTKNAIHGSRAERKGIPRNVDEYLAAIPEPGRSTLNRIRAAIRAASPVGTIETISYGMPAFKYRQVLMWFAAFSDHCSVFPTASIVEVFEKELKGYAKSKGTIKFPLDKPLPAALVRKMVKARVAQIESKKEKRKNGTNPTNSY